MTVDPLEKAKAKAAKWKAAAKAAQAELEALKAKPPAATTEGAVKMSRKAAHTGQWTQADQARVAAAMKAGHPIEWTE